MNEHSHRIIQIMQAKKMSATQFSEAIGIQRAAMSHITVGRNNPSADVLTKIIDTFTDINPGWLLNGKGTMKNETDQADSIVEETNANLFNLLNEEQTKNAIPLRTETDLFETSRLYKRPHSQAALQPATAGLSGQATLQPATAGLSGQAALQPATAGLSGQATPQPINASYGSVIRPAACRVEESQSVENTDEANSSKGFAKEFVQYNERQVKTVEKLVIFFSDKTFETFIPEKADK